MRFHRTLQLFCRNGCGLLSVTAARFTYWPCLYHQQQSRKNSIFAEIDFLKNAQKKTYEYSVLVLYHLNDKETAKLNNTTKTQTQK